MMKLIRFALLSLAFVLSGTAFGEIVPIQSNLPQSNLPACTGSDFKRWSNCFSSSTASNGDKYVGEWKDGKPHGRMIEYQADKSISRSGIYEDGKLIREEIINPVVFTRIAPKK
jgi:hypothetical protein